MLWGLTVFLKAGLLVLLLYRRNYRAFPYFFAYALISILHSAVLFESYRLWGFNSPTSRSIAWGSQGLVILVRALAVAEICRRVLARYRGIWALTGRVLLVTAGFVLLYSWAIARGSWQFAILNSDRAVELAIAAVIVMLFTFAHYYEVGVEPAVRTLAVGFLLYSCFFVLNDTILESRLHRYTALWNLLGTLSFLASLVIWNWALREKQPEATLAPEMLSDAVYRQMTPEINSRLRALNDQLNHFWHAEGKRS
ncbi:MAG: hypothetical protein DMG43_03675 [Acidobacteria bacterium]|nr:MAG: hypothetical protein DMG43_03675 [Acidobacteriota bacterium]